MSAGTVVGRATSIVLRLFHDYVCGLDGNEKVSCSSNESLFLDCRRLELNVISWVSESLLAVVLAAFILLLIGELVLNVNDGSDPSFCFGMRSII
jgi:hypothetical protein